MKTCALMEAFDRLTQKEFSYLRLSYAEAEVRARTITVVLLYPEAYEKDVHAAQPRIRDAVAKACNVAVPVSVRLVKSHFDENFFKTRLFKFLFDYPSLAGSLEERDIEVCFDGAVIRITLHVTEAAYDYCVNKDMQKTIDSFLYHNYCEDIRLTIVPEARETVVDSIDEYEQMMDMSEGGVYENPDEGRTIRTQNVEDFIGPIIYERAAYIEDCIRPKEGLVVCGKIVGLQKIDKKNPQPGKVPCFFKFTLQDPTGEMSCIYFPNKRTVEQMGLLKDGKEVVCRGNLDVDKFRPDSMSYMVRDISLCTLPTDFTVNRIIRKVDDKYRYVFPSPYFVVEQDSLFKEEQKLSPFLMGKTFCVFDIETTGLKTTSDKIIEIGAVKVVDGLIKEQFSTYIDPQIPIPPEITKLTTITDEDVAGQPTIDQVLPDFYKFSHETIMVGQNVQFDYGFIASFGKAMNIYFDNERMDTLILARKYIPELKKFNLGKLAEYFKVVNKGAHRAIYDAIATAEIFIKLTNYIA